MIAGQGRCPDDVTEPQAGHGACPHLVRCDDEETFIAYPALLNQCRKAPPSEAVSLHYQATFCLKPEHARCPVAASEWSGRLPAKMRARRKRQKRRVELQAARHWRLRILIPVLTLCGLAVLWLLLAQSIP